MTDSRNGSASLVFRDAQAVLAGGCSSAAVSARIEGGTIREVGDSVEVDRGARVIDARGYWLLPGFVDLQVNDGEWLAAGPRSPPEHARRIREVARWQARRGVTGLLLATLAAPADEIEGYLRGMKLALDDPGEAPSGVLLGGLVEGTFMNPSCHGAHNPAWIVPPAQPLVDRFLDTGAVRVVNIAPEMAPNALETIRHIRSRGALVACGHARPNARRVREAVAAGLSYVIHLGNGPTGSSLKAFEDGGLLEEALRNDALTITVIGDGIHIHPEIVRDWIARKEITRVVAVSDSGFALGPPRGPFEVFGVRGEPSEDGTWLRVVGGEAAEGGAGGNSFASGEHRLFGSAVDQSRVFENCVNLLTRDMPGVHQRAHRALGLEEAVCAAADLASANASRLLGLEGRGRLGPGQRADLVLARFTGGPGAYRMEVAGVWVAGAPVGDAG